jgi:hypothetical protein
VGGTFDPSVNGHERYQHCRSVLLDSQSICHQYYLHDDPNERTSSIDDVLVANADNHKHNADSMRSIISWVSTSLVSIVTPLRSQELPSSETRPRKRESSSSSDSDKRRRSNENLLEEDNEDKSSTLTKVFEQ